MLRPLLIIILLFTNKAQAERVLKVHLKNNTVSTLKISDRGAVLNFPSKPTKVILGNSGVFAIEYINNDLVISPLRFGARAHLFVYLGQRRFNLDLLSTPKGHTLIQVRDRIEKPRRSWYGKK